MDIHKPRPWRGWREFLREYAIIVVGVLTALGGEQGVQWLHQRADLSEARAALRIELARNAQVALFSLQENQCFLKRDAQMLRWAAGGKRPPLSNPGYFPVYATSTWEAAKSGVVMHMPLVERTTYTRFYDLLEGANANTRRHTDAVMRAAPYATAEQLTPDEATHLRQEISVVRVITPISLGDERAILERARELKLPAPTLTAGQLRALDVICRDASQ
jgi:hypothetical protein